MSKMDNLRALREARYEQDRATRSVPAEDAAPRKTRTPAARTPARKPAIETTAAPSTDAACGHRAISGRACTRPAGHAEKNHRYA
ncbi:hypothetical protein [Nocardioides marmotae]|uniref:Uncharacterized protein n=1 Tax=Nocardioides marmotae TaxID=2663857 RepID=A0A6I3JDJ4_9ACTN|nr:hypothetical protein [Nocardioides marmotae]MCR6032490.1 hypothetical protein [Gordonia jinghuaiqii]MBC9734270.1 hypothetical protein [Nocardioides marmotae]MTB85371.1 hypothetical protein [Nocardioides marmotae]MTB96139.1 hypothetical protein [Nocardioides marmotae]QKD99784.1 hypothetical protein HPC71_00750 [Nocardioides marmotae]